MGKPAAVSAQNYNGWTNYETWAVNLWLENEETSYRHWRDAAAEVRAGKFLDNSDRIRNLADRLKSEVNEAADVAAEKLIGTLWGDLLGAALTEVNWHEIAEHLLEE